MRAHRSSLKAWAPKLTRLVDLIVRLDAHEAELAATVHYVAQTLSDERTARPTELDAFEAVKSWKLKRRPPVTDQDIGEAVRSMNALGWVDLVFSPELPLPAGLDFELDEPAAAE